MNLKNFFLYAFLQWLILILVKLWFFKFAVFSNYGLEQIVFWIFVGVIASAMSRRLGVISFLEAFFVMFLWTVIALFTDLVVTSVYTGLSIFSTGEYWWGLVVMNAVIFVTHKKRHIKVRHELHAKAHAHAHPNNQGHGDNHKKH